MLLDSLLSVPLADAGLLEEGGCVREADSRTDVVAILCRPAVVRSGRLEAEAPGRAGEK
jgi:hypothetical protein